MRLANSEDESAPLILPPKHNPNSANPLIGLHFFGQRYGPFHFNQYNG
uniref:Uncharacterized protein n=1 Tax=Anguilla anguilla TaxID=7936 RepID=A0A0E9VRT1_ANGAN